MLSSKQIPQIGYIPLSAYQQAGIQDSVLNFRHDCLADSLTQDSQIVHDTPSLIQWVQQHHFKSLYVIEPKQGLWNPVLPALEIELHKNRLLINAGKPRLRSTISGKREGGILLNLKTNPQTHLGYKFKTSVTRPAFDKPNDSVSD